MSFVTSLLSQIVAGVVVWAIIRWLDHRFKR